MYFAKKLRRLMSELSISQAGLHELTGIPKSSICQYLAGKNEPLRERKKEIARALGVQDNYFEPFEETVEVQADSMVNLPVPLVAKLMGKSTVWVMQGLRHGVFPWGYAVKLQRWSYFISPIKFTEYTGIKVPMKNQKETTV